MPNKESSKLQVGDIVRWGRYGAYHPSMKDDLMVIVSIEQPHSSRYLVSIAPLGKPKAVMPGFAWAWFTDTDGKLTRDDFRSAVYKSRLPCSK